MYQVFGKRGRPFERFLGCGPISRMWAAQPILRLWTPGAGSGSRVQKLKIVPRPRFLVKIQVLVCFFTQGTVLNRFLGSVGRFESVGSGSGRGVQGGDAR